MLRLLSGILCLVALVSPALASPWSVGPVGAWVDLQDPPGASEEVESEGGYRALLHDEQVLEAPGRHARFSRRVFLLESLEGARIFDGFSTDFDPSWQKVTLHWARILRGGKVLDRLDLSRIRLLSREDRLEEGQIDGWRTLHLVLEDLRPGDVLDYAWTIEGSHPALAQVASGSFQLQLPWVAERLRSRLVWERSDSLRIQVLHGAEEPQEVRQGGRRILTWDLSGTEAADEPDNTPAWWSDVPTVDWTNLPDWESIARLQLPFYAGIDRPEPAVVELAARLQARYPDAPARIAGVLRYLQDSIRYLGYEGGIGSHVPRAGSVTLKARQGDCKDKSLLMASLLRRMGIEAHPTLVLTSGDRTLDQRLPSPWFFDHVVVTVRHGGRAWVLDPTDRDQRGPLEGIPPPDFRWSLVLEPASKGLVLVPKTESVQPEYELVETWDASAGPSRPATLVREVVRRGRVAEGFRARIAQSSLQDEIDQELKSLRKAWPKLERDDEPSMVDDSLTGEIRWTSRFVCDSFWYAVVSDRVWKFAVGSPLMEDAAVDPVDTADRRSPLAVFHPARYHVQVGVKLPADGWETDVDSTLLDLGPLSYRFHRTTLRDTFALDWTWRTTDDHVEAERIGEWARAMDSIQSEANWTLTLDRRTWIGKINWPVSFLVTLVLVLATLGSVLAWRWDPPVQPSRGPGIASGWWVLYALGLVATPFMHGYALVNGEWMFDPYQWSDQFIAAPEASLLALVALTTECAWIPASILLAVLFFRRRSSFPALNMALLATILSVELSVNSMGFVLGAQDSLRDLAQTLGRLPGLVGWSIYFLVSERSKSVFVRKLSGAPPEAAAEPGNDASSGSGSSQEDAS
ncbi:MAG TPA: DUF3857 domain-containing protein [Fibrobacteria bacterium]|nr:DUF3857 domain-containing protein [Fibrobacteria bacterium]HOX51152.1 DUF3857 domain-containing protein [Fibrobacteria bacterium]